MVEGSIHEKFLLKEEIETFQLLADNAMYRSPENACCSITPTKAVKARAVKSKESTLGKAAIKIAERVQKELNVKPFDSIWIYWVEKEEKFVWKQPAYHLMTYILFVGKVHPFLCGKKKISASMGDCVSIVTTKHAFEFSCKAEKDVHIIVLCKKN